MPGTQRVVVRGAATVVRRHRDDEAAARPRRARRRGRAAGRARAARCRWSTSIGGRRADEAGEVLGPTPARARRAAPRTGGADGGARTFQTRRRYGPAEVAKRNVGRPVREPEPRVPPVQRLVTPVEVAEVRAAGRAHDEVGVRVRRREARGVGVERPARRATAHAAPASVRTTAPSDPAPARHGREELGVGRGGEAGPRPCHLGDDREPAGAEPRPQTVSIASIAASSPRLSPCWFTTSTWVTPARVTPAARPARASATNPTPVSVRRNGRCTTRNGAASPARDRRARTAEPGCRYRPLAGVPTTAAARRRSASPAGVGGPAVAAAPGRDRVLDAVERMAGAGAVRLDRTTTAYPAVVSRVVEVGPRVAAVVADELVGGAVAIAGGPER